MIDLNSMIPESHRNRPAGAAGGMPKQNRPPDPVENMSSTTEASAGGKAGESKPTSSLQAGISKGAAATGDKSVFGAMGTALVKAVPGPGGEPGNNNQLPSNYPVGSSSRAPTAGTPYRPRDLSRVQTKKK